MSDREVWRISAIIEATAEQAEAAQDAIARALCPDDKHPGYCEVPWTLMACRFEALDDDAKVAWQEGFDEDRRHARGAGESGA